MKVHLEMTRQVGENAVSSVVGTGLASIVIFFVLDGTVPRQLLLLWLAIQVLLLGARLYFAKVFNNFDTEDEQWAKAVGNFTGAMFFIGLGWGMASVLTALYGTLLDQVVILAILLGVVGAAIGTVAQVLSAYTAFLLSAMSPQILSFLLFAEEKHPLLGLLTIVYSVVVYRAGYTLAANIRDLVEVREHLASAKSAAEEANMAKSQFLSRMSHELRTPLNAVIGFSQIQERYFDETTPPNLRQSRDHILLAGKHLLALIDDILDIVKIEQNKLDLSLDTVDLDTAIEASLSLVKNQAGEMNITLSYEQTGFSVMASSPRLIQVLVNLLSNAIKYNHKCGAVTLSAKALAQGQIEVVVEDTGVGIDPKDQEKVFAPFSRLTYATHNEIDGTGIGLALSKFLVEHMNGRIGFDPAPVQGTVFWLRLPQGEAVESEPSLDSDYPTISTHLVHTVLYIEDSPASRQLLEMTLSQYPDLRLLTAHDAEEGIEIAKKTRPDLILIDINLPGIDGLSALKIMKNDPTLGDTRMVAISADAMPQQVDTAMKAGFDQYLTKPVELNQIVKVIEAL